MNGWFYIGLNAFYTWNLFFKRWSFRWIFSQSLKAKAELLVCMSPVYSRSNSPNHVGWNTCVNIPLSNYLQTFLCFFSSSLFFFFFQKKILKLDEIGRLIRLKFYCPINTYSYSRKRQKKATIVKRMEIFLQLRVTVHI